MDKLYLRDPIKCVAVLSVVTVSFVIAGVDATSYVEPVIITLNGLGYTIIRALPDCQLVFPPYIIGLRK